MESGNENLIQNAFSKNELISQVNEKPNDTLNEKCCLWVQHYVEASLLPAF